MNSFKTGHSCFTAADSRPFYSSGVSGQRKYVVKNLYDAGVKEFESLQECEFSTEETTDRRYAYYFDQEGRYLGVYRDEQA